MQGYYDPNLEVAFVKEGFLSRIGATLAGLMADKPLIVSDLRD